MSQQNVVGPQIRKIRNDLQWSQETLAARLNLLGWDISRGTLSKIEARLRCVTDRELLLLSTALGVEPGSLLTTTSKTPHLQKPTKKRRR